MTTLTKDRILDDLKRIAAPDGRGNIVSAGLISDIVIEGGEVTFALSAIPPASRRWSSCRPWWSRR